jgi:hypothetical protein
LISRSTPLPPSGGAHDCSRAGAATTRSGGLNEFTGKSALGLSSVGRCRIGLDRASAAAFIWRLMTRIHTLEIVVGQHQCDLDVSQSANESALLRLAERLALLHDDHYRLRETIGGLPSRADIHDLELRLGERMDSLAARFDRALDAHLS